MSRSRIIRNFSMLGIDIVEIEQVRRIYKKHGRAFLEKILCQQEIEELLQADKKLLARMLSIYFASKEAIFKACDHADLSWKDITIRNIAGGPLIKIHRPHFNKKITLTFSAARDMVIAQAIAV